MVVGIDGAFVKAGHTRPGQRHQFEILTGRIEASQLGGEAFAVVRDLDPYAKRRVQAILRCCGRGQDTDLRILSDGEDGLRGVIGWFGKNASIVWIGSMLRDGSRESKRSSCISPTGTISRNASRLTGQT
jgi:hypothetical protein